MRRRNFLTALAMTGFSPLCTNPAIAEDKAHWGYGGHAGPEHWASLDKANAASSAGTQQSPLNITGSIDANIPPISTAWKNGGKMVNNGHTIQVNVPPGGVLRRGDQTYELLQYHFHHPSEHRIEGRPSAMEVHFVHKKGGGTDLGVLGVLLAAGAANTAFAQLAAAFPAKAGHEVAVAAVDPAGLLPASPRPCTENVDWMVVKAPVEVAERDIASFAALYSSNARPVKPGSRRLILSSR